MEGSSAEMTWRSDGPHRAAVLALAGTHGSLSRTEIAHRLGLSPATVTQVTKQLIAHGLLVETASAPSRGGRPARLLGLAGGARYALGVKVAPDHLAFAQVALDGSVRGLTVCGFDPRSSDALGYLADTLAGAIGALDRDALLGVGIGIPGGVRDPAEGVVNADVLGWRGLPLGRRLRSALGLPVLVDNDVHALAVGERLYGRGRVHRDLLIVTVGIGIGAAIIANGAVYRGAHGHAGEFGHVPVLADGPRCACGNRGCLEAIVGDRALVAQARRDGVVGAGAGIAELRAAADRDDPGARVVFHRAGEILGRAVAGLVNVVDPETVAIFGEGLTAWRHWRPGFEPALRAHLPAIRNHIPVEVDSWDDETWTQGAAALVLAAPYDPETASSDQAAQVRARLTTTPHPREPALPAP